MVRRRSEKAAQSEARVKDALNQVHTKTATTGYGAAKATGASKSTVYRRLSGGKNRAEARQSQQLLHDHEEKALIAWITMMSATGNPVGHACVKEMAEEIRSQRVLGINDESIALVSYPPIGKD
jgi:Tc5 transposase DNA-binding domain